MSKSRMNNNGRVHSLIDQESQSDSCLVFLDDQVPMMEDDSYLTFSVGDTESQIANYVIPKQKPFTLCYENVLWSVFFACTAWAVVDRLTVNVWSLGVDRKLSSDAVWTVQVFEVVSWVSGRISLVTTSLLFLTQCRVTMNVIATHKPSWLVIGDIHVINNRIHAFAGWLTGIIILLHVWLIFLPIIFQGIPVRLLAKQSMRATIPFYDLDKKLLTLAPDDMWRLIEMTLLFGLVFPLSRTKFLKLTRFRLAMILHVVGAIMFAVDIIRKKSHPHSKVFNMPVVIYWALDRCAGMYFYRRGTATITHVKNLDNGAYLILFLKLYDLKGKSVEGEHIYFHLPGNYLGKNIARTYAHPFTIWHNRGILNRYENKKINFKEHRANGTTEYVWNRLPTMLNTTNISSSDTIENTDTECVHRCCPLPQVIESEQLDPSQMKDQSTAVEVEPEYDVACIVKIIHPQQHAAEQCAVKNCDQTWTEKLIAELSSNNFEKEYPELFFYGPYNSIFNSLKTTAMDLPALMFIGSGAGASPLIDFHQYLVHNNIILERPIVFLYTCNSPQLFEYVASILMSKHIDLFTCKGWITNSGCDTIQHKYCTLEQRRDIYSRKYSRDIEDVNSRIQLEQEILKAKDNLGVQKLFYCGNPNFRSKVENICKVYGVSFQVSDY